MDTSEPIDQYRSKDGGEVVFDVGTITHRFRHLTTYLRP